jgi:tetratricopeptide (TPR) repeat protein
MPTWNSPRIYRRFLDHNPDEPKVSNNLANLLLEQGKVQEALTLALTARSGAPRSPIVLDTLGWALEKAGRPKEALPYLEETGRLLPDNPEVLLHREINLRSLGRGKDADGLRARREKLTRTPRPASTAGEGSRGR